MAKDEIADLDFCICSPSLRVKADGCPIHGADTPEATNE